jgi:ankyrin repeat protein
MGPHQLVRVPVVLLAACISTTGCNRLHEAAQLSDTTQLRELLATANKRGLVPDCDCGWLLCDPCSIDDSHRGGVTPLIYAAGMGHADAVQLIYSAGADIDEARAPVNDSVCALGELVMLCR